MPLRSSERRSLAAVATLLATTPLLRWTLHSPHGSGAFLRRTVLLQSSWAVGALLSRRRRSDEDPVQAVSPAPQHEAPALEEPQARTQYEPSIIRPVATAGAAVGVFVVGGTVIRYIPWLRREALDVLDFQRHGSTAFVVATALSTGVTEELFFRGGLYEVLQERTPHPAVASTALYTMVTAGSGNPLLTFAASLLGAVCGRERALSGDVRGSAIIHVVWAGSMITILPRILRERGGKGRQKGRR